MDNIERCLGLIAFAVPFGLPVGGVALIVYRLFIKKRPKPLTKGETS